mmetsp:Transcript_8004/g.13769  ORF Transcript_8004/g.13769 Transcript_8004/m.13769 type:complete len:153 (-) Transcript_8004:122-580(-)|eukprot:CAMPEP_0119115870 /NCGR_PEP_ID=MMETSP1180-20130426/51979_1 /TAXON_ID=3052 ORGANISM="Chlamydomonas cf sp, Strain CCMP681" /NCGR_SAMPLE_ID=MMETSP1180 /ASSEMBLY_ACC=CAM_ASM_000741 /LENGTH=152 /DNA_ID=CAMNT_0007104973 /DNA_START=238 /DNA_END=696 /DNA_ORIENTATION=+
MASTTLFEDIFRVTTKDPDGKKFDHVSRYVCRSDVYECDLTLDVNTDVYPLEVGGKYNVLLASTLSLDGASGPAKYDAAFPTISGKPSLMDKYDYVMHGKVYKYRDTHVGGQVRVEVYVSFGGLLLLLVGDPKKMERLEVDSSLYLLMKRVD